MSFIDYGSCLVGLDPGSTGREQDIRYQQSRQSPSPTHQGLQPQRSAYGHGRRDSDTLRSLAPPTGSPTVMESQRVSPPLSVGLQTRYSPPTSSVSTTAVSRGRVSPPKGRLSPPAATKGRVSPTAKGRLSPASSQIGREVAKHRRSPTAPEAPTTSGMMRDPNTPSNGVGKTWAGTSADRAEKEDEYEYGGVPSSGERERERQREMDKDKDRERERERERVRERNREQDRRGHQSHMSLQHQQYSQSSAPSLAITPAPPPPGQLNRHIVVRLFFLFISFNFTDTGLIGKQESVCSIGYDRQRRIITRLPCTQPRK